MAVRVEATWSRASAGATDHRGQIHTTLADERLSCHNNPLRWF
jgi:hypothetical protein